MSTSTTSGKKTSRSMKTALREVEGIATPEKLFLKLLKKGPHSALWGILLRLNLNSKAIQGDLDECVRTTTIEVQDNGDRTPQLINIMMVAEEIAKSNEDIHKDCLGVREFLRACVRHRNNHVMRILNNNGLNLDTMIQKAAKIA